MNMETNEKKHHCGCGENFPSEVALTRHYELTECLYCSCGKSFSTKEHLLRHRKTGHGPKSQCKFCGEEFPTKHLLLLHTNQKHTPEKRKICPTCGKDFASGNHLRRHMQNIHGEEDNTDADPHLHPHTAALKSLAYDTELTCTRNDLVIHIQKKHSSALNTATKDLNTKTTENQCNSSPGSSAPVECGNVQVSEVSNKPSNAEVTAYTDSELSIASMLVDMHFFTDTSPSENDSTNESSIESDLSAATIPEAAPVTRKRTTTDKDVIMQSTLSHICHICGRGFRSKYNLVVHSESHLPAGFHCSTCSQEFRSKKKLNKHVQAKHPDLLQTSASGEEEQSTSHGKYMPDDMPICQVVVKSLRMEDLPQNTQFFDDESESSLYSVSDCAGGFDENESPCSTYSHNKTDMNQGDTDDSTTQYPSTHEIPDSVLSESQNENSENMCHICKKVLCNQTYLRKHIAAHSDPRRCKKCFKRFKGRNELNEHLATVHSDVYSGSYFVEDNSQGIESEASSACNEFVEEDALLRTKNITEDINTSDSYSNSATTDDHEIQIEGDYLNQDADAPQYESLIPTQDENSRQNEEIIPEIAQPRYEIQMNDNIDFQDPGSPSDQVEDNDEKDIVGHACHICSKVLCNKSYLKKHVAMHANISDDRCRMCFKVFRPKSRLYAHLVSEHNIRDCDSYFASCFNDLGNMAAVDADDNLSGAKTNLSKNKSDFDSPMVTSQTVEIQDQQSSNLCHICNKNLSTKTYLKKHIAMHSEADRCKMCFKVFRPKSRLYAHLATEHNIKESDSYFSSTDDSLPVIPSKSPKYTKDLPNKTQALTGKSIEQIPECTAEPNNHLNVNSNDNSRDIEISAEMLGMSPEYLPMKSAPVTSPISEFNCHDEISHIPSPATSTSSHMYISKHHGSETPESSNGSIVFADELSLGSEDNHIDLVGEESYQCEVCCRMFRSKYSLHVHARIHLLDRCPHCSKVYSKKKALVKHIQKVHGTDNPQCTLIGETIPRTDNSTPDFSANESLEVATAAVEFEPSQAVLEGADTYVEEYSIDDLQDDGPEVGEMHIVTYQLCADGDESKEGDEFESESQLSDKASEQGSDDLEQTMNIVVEHGVDSMPKDNVLINVNTNHHDDNMSGIEVLGSDVVIDTAEKGSDEENQVLICESDNFQVTEALDGGDEVSTDISTPKGSSNDDTNRYDVHGEIQPSESESVSNDNHSVEIGADNLDTGTLQIPQNYDKEFSTNECGVEFHDQESINDKDDSISDTNQICKDNDVCSPEVVTDSTIVDNELILNQSALKEARYDELVERNENQEGQTPKIVNTNDPLSEDNMLQMSPSIALGTETKEVGISPSIALDTETKEVGMNYSNSEANIDQLKQPEVLVNKNDYQPWSQESQLLSHGTCEDETFKSNCKKEPKENCTDESKELARQESVPVQETKAFDEATEQSYHEIRPGKDRAKEGNEEGNEGWNAKENQIENQEPEQPTICDDTQHALSHALKSDTDRKDVMLLKQETLNANRSCSEERNQEEQGSVLIDMETDKELPNPERIVQKVDGFEKNYNESQQLDQQSMEKGKEPKISEHNDRTSADKTIEMNGSIVNPCQAEDRLATDSDENTEPPHIPNATLSDPPNDLIQCDVDDKLLQHQPATTDTHDTAQNNVNGSAICFSGESDNEGEEAVVHGDTREGEQRVKGLSLEESETRAVSIQEDISENEYDDLSKSNNNTSNEDTSEEDPASTERTKPDNLGKLGDDSLKTDTGKDTNFLESRKSDEDCTGMKNAIHNSGRKITYLNTNSSLLAANKCFVLIKPLDLKQINARVQVFDELDRETAGIDHHVEDERTRSQPTVSNPEPKSLPKKLEYKCDLCFKFFRTKRSLIRHSRIPNCINLKVCTMCDKEFPRTSALERHVKMEHGVKKSSKLNSKYLYVCEICGMQVKTKRSLSGHMALHSRKSTSRCTVCRKTFEDIVELERHILSLHGIRMKTSSAENSVSSPEEKTKSSATKSADTEFMTADSTATVEISSDEDEDSREYKKLVAEALDPDGASSDVEGKYTEIMDNKGADESTDMSSQDFDEESESSELIDTSQEEVSGDENSVKDSVLIDTPDAEKLAHVTDGVASSASGDMPDELNDQIIQKEPSISLLSREDDFYLEDNQCGSPVSDMKEDSCANGVALTDNSLEALEKKLPSTEDVSEDLDLKKDNEDETNYHQINRHLSPTPLECEESNPDGSHVSEEVQTVPCDISCTEIPNQIENCTDDGTHTHSNELIDTDANSCTNELEDTAVDSDPLQGKVTQLPLNEFSEPVEMNGPVESSVITDENHAEVSFVPCKDDEVPISVTNVNSSCNEIAFENEPESTVIDTRNSTADLEILDDNSPEIPENLQDDRTAHPDTSNKFKCGLCDKKYNWKKGLQRHEKNVHGKGQSTTPKKGEDDASFIDDDSVSASPSNFNGSLCDKGFKQKDNVKRHMDECHSDVTYPCSYCTKSYKRMNKLQTHMASAHKSVCVLIELDSDPDEEEDNIRKGESFNESENLLATTGLEQTEEKNQISTESFHPEQDLLVDAPSQDDKQEISTSIDDSSPDENAVISAQDSTISNENIAITNISTMQEKRDLCDKVAVGEELETSQEESPNGDPCAADVSTLEDSPLPVEVFQSLKDQMNEGSNDSFALEPPLLDDGDASKDDGSLPESSSAIESLTVLERFNCPLCTKNYAYKGDLKRHIKVIHEKIKFSCPCCKKKFDRKHRLRAHLASKHKSESLVIELDSDSNDDHCDESMEGDRVHDTCESFVSDDVSQGDAEEQILEQILNSSTIEIINEDDESNKVDAKEIEDDAVQRSSDLTLTAEEIRVSDDGDDELPELSKPLVSLQSSSPKDPTGKYDCSLCDKTGLSKRGYAIHLGRVHKEYKGVVPVGSSSEESDGETLSKQPLNIEEDKKDCLLNKIVPASVAPKELKRKLESDAFQEEYTKKLRCARSSSEGTVVSPPDNAVSIENFFENLASANEYLSAFPTCRLVLDQHYLEKLAKKSRDLRMEEVLRLCSQKQDRGSKFLVAPAPSATHDLNESEDLKPPQAKLPKYESSSLSHELMEPKVADDEKETPQQEEFKLSSPLKQSICIEKSTPGSSRESDASTLENSAIVFPSEKKSESSMGADIEVKETSQGNTAPIDEISMENVLETDLYPVPEPIKASDSPDHEGFAPEQPTEVVVEDQTICEALELTKSGLYSSDIAAPDQTKELMAGDESSNRELDGFSHAESQPESFSLQTDESVESPKNLSDEEGAGQSITEGHVTETITVVEETNKTKADIISVKSEMDNIESPVPENLLSEPKTKETTLEASESLTCESSHLQNDTSHLEDVSLVSETQQKTSENVASESDSVTDDNLIDSIDTFAFEKPISSMLSTDEGPSKSKDDMPLKTPRLESTEDIDGPVLQETDKESKADLVLEKIEEPSLPHVESPRSTKSIQNDEITDEIPSDPKPEPSKLENAVSLVLTTSGTTPALPKISEFFTSIAGKPVYESPKLETTPSSSSDVLNEPKTNYQSSSIVCELSKSFQTGKSNTTNDNDQKSFDEKLPENQTHVLEKPDEIEIKAITTDKSGSETELLETGEINGKSTSKALDSTSTLDSTKPGTQEEDTSAYPEYYSDSESSVGYYGHSEVESYSCDESSTGTQSDEESQDEQAVPLHNANGSKNSLKDNVELRAEVVAPTSMSIDGVCGQVYKCDICSMYLSSKRSLARHSKIHNKDITLSDHNNVTLSQDSVQPKTEDSYQYLVQEEDDTSSIHDTTLDTTLEEGEVIPGYDSNTEDLNSTDSSGYSLEDRGSTDSSFDDLDDGFEYGASESQLDIGAPLSSSERLDESMSRGNYQCDICSKTYSSRGNLSRHMKVHLRSGKRKCALCDKQYKDDTGLKKHMRDAHRVEYHSYSSIDEVLNLVTIDEERELIKDRCAKSRKRKFSAFPSVSGPRVYRKRRHDKDYSGPVTACPTRKRTTRQDTLVYRTRAIADSQPKECEVCSEVFPNRTALSDHSECFVKH